VTIYSEAAVEEDTMVVEAVLQAEAPEVKLIKF